MDDEHDDDLAPSVDQRGDVEVEDFPASTVAPVDDDDAGADQPDDDELDDEDVVGK